MKQYPKIKCCWYYFSMNLVLLVPEYHPDSLVSFSFMYPSEINRKQVTFCFIQSSSYLHLIFPKSKFCFVFGFVLWNCVTYSIKFGDLKE